MPSLPGIIAQRWRTARLWGRTPPHVFTPGRAAETIARLEAEKSALLAFTAAMEQEFLGLGKLLRQISSLARRVREQSDEIIAAATGQAEDAAIQFAFHLLKKAEDLVHASREQYHGVCAVFEKIHTDLTQIARARTSLLRTLSPLKTTTTQFRIQACAFDETTRSQFLALSETIAAIFQDVQTAFEHRFEALERTGQTAGETVAKLTALANEQKIETEKMLGRTRTHLFALNEALLSSEVSAQSIARSGANIAAGVSKAIVALQCQDIARQQLEHIRAAMDEIVAYLGPATAEALNNSQEADCKQFLSDAGRIQISQLRTVFAKLEGAASQIANGIEEVDSEAKSLAGYAIRSGEATLDGHIIAQAITSIHEVLAVIDGAVGNIRCLGELVAKLKLTFSDCTEEILALALKLRMVAINAQIFSAHVHGGDALEVVAENCRAVTDDAMVELDQISSEVRGLVNFITDLGQRLDDYCELAALDQGLLAVESRESESKLIALESNLRSVLNAIGLAEKELAATLHRAVASIQFPKAVADASARSISLFEQLVCEYSNPFNNGTGSAHLRVRNLARNYTMEHERAVHESALGALATATESSDDGASAPPADPEANFQGLQAPAEEHAAAPVMVLDPESDEQEAGDNFELF